MTDSKPSLPLDAAAPLKRLVDEWTLSLAQVLESMTDGKPEVRWEAASGSLSQVRIREPESAETELLWWEQPFQIGSASRAWAAAPQGVWEHIGQLTLKSAGVESVGIQEARNTWLEILGQSMGGLARFLTTVAGREVACGGGAEQTPDPEPQEWAAVSIAFDGASLPTLWFALSPQLAEFVSVPPEPEPERPASDAPAAVDGPLPGRSRTMDLLLDVDLPISISFGRTQLPLRDVLKLTTGSIVELNRNVNDSVEVLVNERLIARGEVVVVEGNYGVRIQEIASRQERLRSIP